jgi:hypothetical protein
LPPSLTGNWTFTPSGAAEEVAEALSPDLRYRIGYPLYFRHVMSVFDDLQYLDRKLEVLDALMTCSWSTGRIVSDFETLHDAIEELERKVAGITAPVESESREKDDDSSLLFRQPIRLAKL